MPGSPGAPSLELWGGIECSVVRIGDRWRDQVRETGHHARGERDLDLLASLGLRTLRYPILWERAIRDAGWAWHDRQIDRLRELGIATIAGLIHHGSGPAGTGLLAECFPERLAGYAGRAAARYPDMAAWTPVNEPLTTARFACLYGHWYPHERDEGAFLRAVANQCRAILLSMRAIRSHVPRARFLHTEDLGRVFSMPPLARQAEYENSRRWLSLDLLCGRVDKDHAWRAGLERHGVPARHLDELATGEARPDLIGINHYATSDRFLDHRVHLYPPHIRGGNGFETYADTEAVRVDLGPHATGWEPRLREAWERYRLPMAVSESHLGCDDPPEQVRWLVEAWKAACSLRAQGADVRAVTAWALFGLIDWDSMLRERSGRYEPGAFDVRSDPPVPGILSRAIRALATSGEYDDASLSCPGWWRRDDRVHAALRTA